MVWEERQTFHSWLHVLPLKKISNMLIESRAKDNGRCGISETFQNQYLEIALMLELVLYARITIPIPML